MDTSFNCTFMELKWHFGYKERTNEGFNCTFMELKSITTKWYRPSQRSF